MLQHEKGEGHMKNKSGGSVFQQITAFKMIARSDEVRLTNFSPTMAGSKLESQE
jgi:hypothetical protein